ncbi:MAG: hypothetical protein ACREUW_16745 [Burkholderiales bacterium]
MEEQYYPIVHFEAMVRLAQALKALPAQVLEQQYSYESFGSWCVTLRHRGNVSRLNYDGRDDRLSVCRSLDRKPPYSFDVERSVGSGKGLGSLDSAAIEEVCRALAS